MQVVYHSDAFAKSVPYGLGRYAEELWKYLSNKPSLVLQPFALQGNALKMNVGDKEGDISITKPVLDRRLLMACWSLFDSPSIDHMFPEADLVHSVELDYPVVTRLPWITTVHDIGPLSHPEYFSKSRPYLRRQGLRRAAKKAAKIIAVSHATASDISEYLGMDLGERLQVIYEGVDERFFKPVDVDVLCQLSDMPPVDMPYLLWTGSINPRKNLTNVLRAFREVANDIPHHLILAGGIGWDAEKLIADIKLNQFANRIHRPGYVTDLQLRALYQNADAFVYVSLMEGFGLPILEAMASGCPVITSNVSSMPEVAGEAAMLVDPNDHIEIAEAFKAISENDAVVKDEIQRRGYERSKSFNWRKCASAMRQVYESVSV